MLGRDVGLERTESLRRRGMLALGAAVVALAAFLPAARAQTPFDEAVFSGYSTGTVVHADALQSGSTRVVDAEEAFSGASVNSQGLGAAIENEMQRVVQPALSAKNSHGRGSGLEIGFGQAPNAENQIIEAGKAEAAAGPTDKDPVVATEEIGPLPADPVAWASVLRGQARANWRTDGQCILGDDISRGLGYAADAQLVNSGDANADGSMKEPLVAADAPDPERAVSQSLSRTLLVPQVNKQGQRVGLLAFGLMSETRMTIAPVTLSKNTENEFTIEFLGEWVLQALAGGVPGTAFVHYGPGKVSPLTPILRVIRGGEITDILTFQQFFTNEGLVIDVPGVAEIAIGEDPRAIGGSATSNPTEVANGTEAAGAVDVVRLKLFEQKDGSTVTQRAADLRVGHMESRAKVPAGGISCPIPVRKVPNPPGVSVGQTFTTDITVSNPFGCDLTKVKVIDEIRTEAGARFKIEGTDPDADVVPTQGGLEEATIVWNDIGTIEKGKSKTVSVTIRAQAGGLIIDIATANATLGNCEGEASALVGVGVSGVSNEVRVPVVLGERIVKTGVGTPIIAAVSMLVLAGLGVLAMRRRRVA